jgi:hypothetical protein
MGGGIALISGAKDDRVQKIIGLSSWNIGEHFRDADDELLERMRKHLKSQFMLNANPKRFIADLLENIETYSIANYKSQLDSKTILLLDENEKNKQWIEELGIEDYILMKTDHSFSDKRLELIEKISEWINN